GAGAAFEAGSGVPGPGVSTGAKTPVAAPSEPAAADAGPAVVAASRWRAGGAPAGPWVRAALAVTVIGLVTQVLGIVTRGMAEHRGPWGNMYEVVMAITGAGGGAFPLLLIPFPP